MKKIIIGLSLCVASASSMAAAVCAAGTATAVASSTTDFVKTGFTPKCSQNTWVNFDQDTANGGVGSASSKGNQVFGGHTNGGAVTKLTTGGDCAASGCTQQNASDAAATMLTAASSS